MKNKVKKVFVRNNLSAGNGTFQITILRYHGDLFSKHGMYIHTSRRYIREEEQMLKTVQAAKAVGVNIDIW